MFDRFFARFRNPGKVLREVGLERDRERRRAMTDRLRADMGLPPINWKTLTVETPR